MIIFKGWAWRLKIFYHWLVPFTNLTGEWVGKIKSNWKKKELDTIPIEVSIKQNFFNVQVRIKTKESRSYSIGASFDIDNERGFQQLFYTYLNTPKAGVREESVIHYGSTILNFDGFKFTKIDGEYCTYTETIGEITLSKTN